MNKLIPLLLAAALVGCAGVVKVEGEQVVNNRLALKLPEAWNRIDLPGNKQPYESWTQEGLTLDQLRIWAGIPSGQPMMTSPSTSGGAGQKAPRIPTFTAGMPPDQLVGLFETLYSADGSIFSISKVEPAAFAGEKGVYFEFALTRKSDGVQMQGSGWVAVRKNELFAATFTAPRLAFYPKLVSRAEGVVRTAQIKG
jgi:hypothetical protein